MGFLLEAWGPFGQGELFQNEQVKEMATKYGKTVAQLALLGVYKKVSFHCQNRLHVSGLQVI